MVQDVFEVSKAASGQLPVSLKRLDLARLLRQTPGGYGPAHPGERAAAAHPAPRPLGAHPGDSDRLYRVFQNLLGNPKYFPRPPASPTEEGAQAVAAAHPPTPPRPGLDYTQRFVGGREPYRRRQRAGPVHCLQLCPGLRRSVPGRDPGRPLHRPGLLPLDASPSDPR